MCSPSFRHSTLAREGAESFKKRALLPNLTTKVLTELQFKVGFYKFYVDKFQTVKIENVQFFFTPPTLNPGYQRDSLGC